MLTFMEIEKGDTIYYIEVEKFTLPYGKLIKRAIVEDVRKSPNSSTYNVLIRLSNGKEIAVNWNNEAQKIDNFLTVGALSEMNCFIYGTSENACKECLKKALETNADVLRKYLSKVNTNLLKVNGLLVDVSRIEVKKTPETITTEAVYV